MKTLTIYGASDDLIEAEGIEGADEFGAYGKDDAICGKVVVTAGTEVLTVWCIYDGCWSFAVSPWPNEEKLPWPVKRTWGDKMGHSETLEIEVPDNARMTFTRM